MCGNKPGGVHLASGCREWMHAAAVWLFFPETYVNLASHSGGRCVPTAATTCEWGRVLYRNVLLVCAGRCRGWAHWG